MATLKVQIAVTESTKTVLINTEDYIPSEEWQKMLEWEKENAIQEWIDGFDQPCWNVEKITETED